MASGEHAVVQPALCAGALHPLHVTLPPLACSPPTSLPYPDEGAPGSTAAQSFAVAGPARHQHTPAFNPPYQGPLCNLRHRTDLFNHVTLLKPSSPVPAAARLRLYPLCPGAESPPESAPRTAAAVARQSWLSPHHPAHGTFNFLFAFSI